MFGSIPYGTVTFGGVGGTATTEITPFLRDLTRRRGQITVGGNPSRFIELAGGKEVPTSWFEPSAKTFRSDYYYNTRVNKLYKKTKVIHPLTKKLKAYWFLASEC